MAKILCIETGTDICSVALTTGEGGLFVRESGEDRDHARNLGVFVDKVLRDSETKPTELEAVAVGRGPGSYTGLRIGISLAKGLCYGLGVPLIAINSLEALAQVAIENFENGTFGAANFESALLCPMLDARRMEVYTQLFDTQLNALSDVEAKIIDEESFAGEMGEKEFFIFGNGAAKCRDLLTDPCVRYVDVQPSATGLVRLAEMAFDMGSFVDTAYFEPYYLKEFVALKSQRPLF